MIKLKKNPRFLLAATVAAALGLAGCNRADSPADTPTRVSHRAPGPGDRARTDDRAQAADGAVEAASGKATPATPSATSVTPATAPPAIAPFRELVTTLSEADAHFFSDNYVSNETSYLQVAPQLAKTARRGRAYIGVGPEQNFTYIALTRPTIAFVVDIRRENMLLHLLYKSIFDEATTRSHFLSLLVGRPYEATSAPAADAALAAVISHAERVAPDEAKFSASHQRMVERIETTYGIPLDAADKKTLETTHRAFFAGQLDIRFELHSKSGRKYPSLRELLAALDPEGKALGFLAHEDDFRFIQAMQKEHRLIPLVGDFAGDRAMPGVAAYLTQRSIKVSTFYVSNVEQYLLEPKVWRSWMRNVAAMPVDSESLFVRCYLDQGRRHPQQMKGHRTATILQRVDDFKAHQEKKPYGTFWALVSDAMPSGG